MNNDLISRSALKKALDNINQTGYDINNEPLFEYVELPDLVKVIDNAPTVKPQKIVTIPPELIEKLASCVVDTIGNIDWEKAIEAYKARPKGKWIPQTDYDGFTYWKCSKCGKKNDYEVTDFCFRCGADMRGEEE